MPRLKPIIEIDKIKGESSCWWVGRIGATLTWIAIKSSGYWSLGSKKDAKYFEKAIRNWEWGKASLSNNEVAWRYSCLTYKKTAITIARR